MMILTMQSKIVYDVASQDGRLQGQTTENGITAVHCMARRPRRLESQQTWERVQDCM